MFKFSLGEVQRVSGAFQSLANVGGLAGTSIQGMFEASQKLGLSMDSYAKLIGRNSEGLAFAAGSVAAGAQAVQRITTAGTGFEAEFVKLGYSFEQQSEFAAKFLAQNRISNRISLNDTQALSEASRKYLVQVDELARITGKSRDKVAAELQQMQSKLRFGANLALMDKDAAKEAEKLSLVFAQMGPQAQQMFEESVGGLGPKMSNLFATITGGESEALADKLRKGQITAADYMTRIAAAARQFQQNNNMTELEAMAGGMGYTIDEFAVVLRKLSGLQEGQINNMIEATAKQKTDAADKSKMMEDMVKAQISLRDLAKEIDKIVMEKLFPIMSKQVGFFTTSLHDAVKLINKWLNKDKVDTITDADRKAWISETGGVLPFKDGRQLNTEEAAADWIQRGRPKRGAPGADPAASKPGGRRRGGGAAAGGEFDGLQSRGGGAPPGRERGDPTLGGDEPPAASGAAAGGKPKLARVTSTSGPSAMVGAEFQSAFQQLISHLDTTGYNIHTLGGFVDRDKRNQPGVPSLHGLGAAIDINAAQNPMGSQLVTDMPEGIGKVARSLGLGWGGNWNSPKDAMHFSAATSEGGNLLRAAQGAIISGPSSGYRTAIETHGNEVIMPLKKDSPQLMVETKGMEEQLNLMNLQLVRLDSMVSLLQNSTDTQNKIYQATVG